MWRCLSPPLSREEEEMSEPKSLKELLEGAIMRPLPDNWAVAMAEAERITENHAEMTRRLRALDEATGLHLAGSSDGLIPATARYAWSKVRRILDGEGVE